MKEELCTHFTGLFVDQLMHKVTKVLVAGCFCYEGELIPGGGPVKTFFLIREFCSNHTKEEGISIQIIFLVWGKIFGEKVAANKK